jgi:hypothetical protein
MYKIRIIIDNNIDKIYNQYNQIRYLLPEHILYIYKRINKNIEDEVDYNIFIDIISENALKLCPAKNNILLVNEEYVIYTKYLRREAYIDKPLILITDIIDYYICLTKYSENILKKIYNIKKNKIFYLNGLTTNIYLSNYYNNNSQKYILYDIDLYSGQDNLILLKTWEKYFTNRTEKLIIIPKYYKDSICSYNYKLLKEKTYKNIILTSDKSFLSFNIIASIINTSYYNLTTTIYENIFKDRIILTVKNDITSEILPSDFLMDKFDEHNIHLTLNKLFKYDATNINNKESLLKNIKKTKLKINKLLNITNKKLIKFNNEMIKVNIDDPKSLKADLNYIQIHKSHDEIKDEIEKVDNKFKKKDDIKLLDKYYRILQKPSTKTQYAYATAIFLNNTYISTVLATGYIMKYINKTKYNLICFVQDKPYYEDGILKFPGLSEQEINDIGLFYDCVVGIDLLKINVSVSLGLHYINAMYYATKLLAYGFIMYSKIFYYDPSAIIQNNIDYYFTKYNENKYYNLHNDPIKRGMTGNIYIFTPKTYYINKILYLLKNFSKLFAKMYPFYYPDEDLLYYTIYPNWSSIEISANEMQSNFFDRYPYVNIIKKQIRYNFNFYIFTKPFIFCEKNTNTFLNINNTLFNANHMCYEIWDTAIKNIIKIHPELNKYFEFIKTFRYTLF